MDSCSIELKVISCIDLKAFNFFQKLSVYIAGSVVHDDPKKNQHPQPQQRQKTPIDREGGRNPEWNHMMQFDLNIDQCTDLFLKFDLRCEGIIFGTKTMGEVRVAVKDLMDEFKGAVRFVCYQVRTSDGKPNGVLNFSYKVNGNTKKDGSDTKKDGSDGGILEVNSSSGIQLLTDNVQNPSVDVHMDSSSVSYPSLDDVRTHFPRLVVDIPSPKSVCYPSVDVVRTPFPPLVVDIPSPKFYYRTPEFYHTTVPPSPPLPPPMVVHGAYNCPPSPWLYSHMMESTGYGYLGVGQQERIIVRHG